MLNKILIIISLSFSILSIIYHFSRIFSKTPFETQASFYLSILTFFSCGTIFLTSINILLFTIFNSSYFFIFFAYHLMAFFIVYLIIIISLILIKIICILVNKINFLGNLEIIPFKSIFILDPLHRNNFLLRKVVCISYLISILIFIFIFKNYLLHIAGTDNSIDYPLFKADLEKYYNVFFASSLTVILALFKIKK